jgi:hypothetical protein
LVFENHSILTYLYSINELNSFNPVKTKQKRSAMKSSEENDFDVVQEKFMRKKKFEKKFNKNDNFMHVKRIKDPRKNRQVDYVNEDDEDFE